MTVTPSSTEELSKLLAVAHSRGQRVTKFNLDALQRVIEFTPEDMTVSAQAGIRLSELQTVLARRGQWLPVDPPRPAALTIGALLATNANGPRRCGYGTVREYLIGIKVVLADGRLIKAGGKVVKNVAGYDLCKLFIGSFGTLGAIVEASFKLRPLPEAEEFVQTDCPNLQQAHSLLNAIGASELMPTVLDLHNLAPPRAGDSSSLILVLGFAGSREEVAWQLARSAELGVREPSNLNYFPAFWEEAPSVTPYRLSVPPAQISEALSDLGSVRFLAHAANGIVSYRGGRAPAKPELPLELMRRIKNSYDPKSILPEWPA